MFQLQTLKIVCALLVLLVVTLWLFAAAKMAVETVRKAGVRKRSTQAALNHISAFLPQGDKGKYLELSLALCLLLEADTLSEITQAWDTTEPSQETGRAIFRQIVTALDATSPHWYFKLLDRGKTDLHTMYDLVEAQEPTIRKECMPHA